jgi:hypothetical protein
MGWWKNLLLIFNKSKFELFQKGIILILFETQLIKEEFTKVKINFTLEACSSVDRASDSDSESQGFDSLHA